MPVSRATHLEPMATAHVIDSQPAWWPLGDYHNLETANSTKLLVRWTAFNAAPRGRQNLTCPVLCAMLLNATVFTSNLSKAVSYLLLT